MSSMAVVFRDIDTRGKGRKRKRCANASQWGLTVGPDFVRIWLMHVCAGQGG